jgi:hypothetical protein
LKRSVHSFEDFGARFKVLESGEFTDKDLKTVKEKLFVDELFELKLGTG